MIVQAASTDPKDSELMTKLGDISSDILLLPISAGSLQGLRKCGEPPTLGRTTDIWRGTWKNKLVAFKDFRLCPPQDLPKVKRNLWKLIPIWKRLVHENVLSFHGVADTSMFQLALIYDWGHGGNVTEYLKSNPDASRPELVSIHPT